MDEMFVSVYLIENNVYVVFLLIDPIGDHHFTGKGAFVIFGEKARKSAEQAGADL